jgi:hypothetical protein
VNETHFKATVYQKKSNGTLYTSLQRTTSIYYLSVILTKNLLSASMENTLNGEKSLKIKPISVINRTP